MEQKSIQSIYRIERRRAASWDESNECARLAPSGGENEFLLITPDLPRAYRTFREEAENLADDFAVNYSEQQVSVTGSEWNTLMKKGTLAEEDAAPFIPEGAGKKLLAQAYNCFGHRGVSDRGAGALQTMLSQDFNMRIIVAKNGHNYSTYHMRDIAKAIREDPSRK